jgi:tight adherence protein C
MDPWFTFVLCTAALAAACALLGLATAWHRIPSEDRTWREPPPPVLRLLWPLTRAFAHHLGPLLPRAYRSATAQRLQRAELSRAVTPEQWVGGRVAWAMLAAAGASFSMSLLARSPLVAACVGGALGLLVPQVALRDAIQRRELRIQRELPTFLDVLTLAVESGCSLVAAVGIATDKAQDGPLRRAFERFLAELRGGRSRADALQSLDEWVALPAMTSLVGALLQAERTGARLGDVLRAQSTQRTNERFARAEKLAMQAPVKMLGPLILCIFPCTFLIIGFPIGMKLTEGF